MKKFAVLACILSLLIPAVVLAGCGGTSTPSSTETPGSVAKAFWSASLQGDAATSWSLLAQSIRSRVKDQAAWASSGVTNTLNGGSIQVGKTIVKGNSATVTIKIMSSSGKEIMSEDVSLVKENGAWKIEIP
jgi:hypothetical protein